MGWYGVIGPAGVPAPVVARLHEEFRRFMRADMDKWAKLVKESGAKLD